MPIRDDPFNRPFRLLDPLDFPARTDGTPKPESDAQRCSRHGAMRHASPRGADRLYDDAARELFFSAMRKLAETAPRKQERSGFRLAALCALPSLDAVVKKSPVQAAAKGATPESGAKEQPRSEEALFLEAARGASPLSGGGRDLPRKPRLGAPPALGQMSLQDFMEGRLEFAISNTDEYLEGHVVGLDEPTMNKLRQGEFSPEAHLDLHGLNSMQAFETLRHFFRAAWYKSIRCVLLVPGRGRNSPDGLGVLRAKLQIWLVQEPFKRIVLAFCTARPCDGGPGSVYVLLRKFRKKGRICWDRMPADADLY